MPVIEPFLARKQEEIIWSLSDTQTQGYSMGMISKIMNGMPKSTIQGIINRKPKDWKPKWIKAD